MTVQLDDQAIGDRFAIEHARQARSNRTLSQAVGWLLGAIATVIAALACMDPLRWSWISIFAAMLLYAGAAAAFWRAEP